MNTLNNHTQLLIGKNITNTVTVGLVVTPSNIADGEIAVVDVDGKVLDASTVTAKDKVFLVQGQGSTKPLIKSAAIDKSGVFNYRAKAYSAGTEEVEYIGFNAVTSAGSITVTSDNPYQIKSVLISNTIEFADKQMFVEADYVSDSSATQVEIATGLVKSVIANSEKFVNVPFKAERVSNGTFAASSGGATTVTNKSKTITIVESAGAAADAGKYAADASVMAVGDVLRIGGTGTAEAIYVITAISGVASALCTITLDVPYQGTSGSVSAANLGVLTSITSYGIKLTGLPKTFSTNILKYEKNKWKSIILGAGSTPVAITTNAAEGTGRYEQIADEEYFFQLAEGAHDTVTIQIPPVVMRTNVSVTGTYSIVDVRWKATEGTAIVANSVAYKQLRLAFDKQGGAISNWQANATNATPDLGVLRVLDAWLSTLPAQVGSL